MGEATTNRDAVLRALAEVEGIAGALAGECLLASLSGRKGFRLYVPPTADSLNLPRYRARIVAHVRGRLREPGIVVVFMTDSVLYVHARPGLSGA